MGFENRLHVRGNHHHETIGQRLEFIAMQDVGAFIVGIGTMQTLTEPEFFAEPGGVWFGGEERISSAFDDELTVIKSDTVSSNLAAPAIQRFEKSDLRVAVSLYGVVRSR